MSLLKRSNYFSVKIKIQVQDFDLKFSKQTLIVD